MASTALEPVNRAGVLGPARRTDEPFGPNSRGKATLPSGRLMTRRGFLFAVFAVLTLTAVGAVGASAARAAVWQRCGTFSVNGAANDLKVKGISCATGRRYAMSGAPSGWQC